MTEYTAHLYFVCIIGYNSFGILLRYCKHRLLPACGRSLIHKEAIMGNNLKTGLTIKILIGCLVSGFICVMLYAFGAYDDIIMDKPAVIVQILGSMIFGAICMGTQIVYDIESWGIRRSTAILKWNTFRLVLSSVRAGYCPIPFSVSYIHLILV